MKKPNCALIFLDLLKKPSRDLQKTTSNPSPALGFPGASRTTVRYQDLSQNAQAWCDKTSKQRDVNVNWGQLGLLSPRLEFTEQNHTKYYNVKKKSFKRLEHRPLNPNSSLALFWGLENSQQQRGLHTDSTYVTSALPGQK